MTRILLIDDDDSMRPMLRQTLTHFGYAVIEACDGKEGLALFASTEVDLVITDIVMPEKDGFEVLMALRNKRPAVKIIAISGGSRGATDYFQLAKKLGATKVLQKPFPNALLLEAVNELLPRGAAVPSATEPILPVSSPTSL